MRIERRGRQPHHEFAMIPNDTARDKSLSFRARGILTLILSHQDGFDVTADRVAKEGSEGRDAVRTAFTELETAGYIRRVKTRGDDGRMRTKIFLYPYGDAPEKPDPEPETPPEQEPDEPEDEDQSPTPDFQASVDQSPVGQSYKEDHQEDQSTTAAAVLEVGDQQQQQHEDAPIETMEQAVAVIAETLGGEVLADTQPPPVYVCDGCMRPVVRAQIADMADGEHVLCVDCKDDVPHSGAPETIAEQMARSGHGVRGTHLNPEPQPGSVRPFPVVEQRKLVNWFAVTSAQGEAWESAWRTACAMETEVYYEPSAHMAIYLSRCREENRQPRSDLWLRFYIEDRAKHIQTLQHEQDAALRREEDPQQREDRSNRSLPPTWGTGEGE